MPDNSAQPGGPSADRNDAPVPGAAAAGAAPDEAPGAAAPPESGDAGERNGAVGSEAAEATAVPAETAGGADGEEPPAVEEPLSVEEQLRRERDELKERWLRTAAELENFRKRTRRELEDARVHAVAGLLRDLLEVLDNFERATISMQNPSLGEVDLQTIKDGVALIHQRFREIVLAQGLERIEAEGVEFNPALHEAILQVEQEGVAPGQIAEVVQPGYRLRNLVIRPARVIVAK